MRSRALTIVLAAAVLGGAAPALAQQPIPEGTHDEPGFIGAPAQQRPVEAPPLAPQHPFLARNGASNIHDDAYMTDAYDGPGPLGRGISRRNVFEARDCASVTFDSKGRIVTVCVGLDRPVLTLKDPVTLATLASLPLPPRQAGVGNPFQDFTGGGYFYLDERDRAVLPTTQRHLLIVEQTAEPGFRVVRDVDLNGAVAPDDKIVSVLPDWSGRLWFVAQSGIVGTVGRDGGPVRTFDTNETISNSFSVDEDGGVYIVTDGALYRFRAAGDGTPVVAWRTPYANTGVQKPGQASRGSGTTPTVGTNGAVSITDNADPMNVVVYERRTGAEVCRAPVFDPGASATDNSLIMAGGSIVVENNFGYTGPGTTQNGASTSPGIERVDFDLERRACRKVWRSQERSPTVVPKLSLANGLVYVYTKEPQDDGDDVWYLTAIDFHTGETVFKALAGEGLGHNNNYAPITLGPDGSAYVGVLGGLVRLADAQPPPGAGASRGQPAPPQGTRSPRVCLAAPQGRATLDRPRRPRTGPPDGAAAGRARAPAVGALLRAGRRAGRRVAQSPWARSPRRLERARAPARPARPAGRLPAVPPCVPAPAQGVARDPRDRPQPADACARAPAKDRVGRRRRARRRAAARDAASGAARGRLPGAPAAPAPRLMAAVWRNWAGEQACTPARIARPRSTEEVGEEVRRAREQGRVVRVAGAGHSFTDAVLTDGVLLSLDAMDRVVWADPGGRRVRVQAGIRLHALSERLARFGLALENLGDVNVQSIAGAIATGTHGTGAELRNVSSQVEAVQLVAGDGTVHELDSGDALLAARVSVGALGVVTEVTLRCVPAYVLRGVDASAPLAGVLERLDEAATSARHFELYAFPFSDTVMTRTNEIVPAPATPPDPVRRWTEDVLLNNVAFGGACRAARRVPRAIPRISRGLTATLSERTRTDRADRVFASPRLVRFTEMELAFPREAARPAIEAVLREVRRHPVIFPIEVRFVAGDDALLSPAGGRETVYIAVHNYRGMPFEPYFRAVQAIGELHGARPHWGKRHFHTASSLAPLYPGWERFQAVRAELDPEGRFTNAYVRRALGPPATEAPSGPSAATAG